jgi:asparagine synthase (glutamine-hydrolysing)
MANFLAVCDPDKNRRLAFQKKCTNEIAIFKDLKHGRLSMQNYTVLWAANPKAPISKYQSEGETAIVFGDAIRPGSSNRVSAKELTEDWADIKSAKTHYYDGYYCALHFSKKEGLMIGGDILGLFPVYYYSNGEVTLAGSSPELFRYHNSFKPELCMEGLTGMLLTMHSVTGQTLWKNVRRLKFGHILVGSIKAKPEEILQYKIPLSDKYYGLPFSHQIELIHEKMGEAISRHAPSNQTYSLLFSGGLDSRMMAGYLRERKEKITAITLGKSSDIEMKLAKKVMKSLPFQYKCMGRPFDDYHHYAKLTARWEHGLNGFNTIHNWGLVPILNRQHSGRVISGIHHDGIFSGSYANHLRSGDSSEEAFFKILGKVTEWGISVDDLQELFLTESDKANVNIVVDNLKELYYGFSDSDYGRTWCYEMFNRGRFHHGGAIWKWSFGAWPVIPIIDSALLEIIAGLPCATKSNRMAQRALVKAYFPDLAEFVLDSNSNKPEPLISTWPFLLKKAITRKTFVSRPMAAIKRRLTGPWHANLYYHRIYNIDNNGWKSVREKAEPGRSFTDSIMDQEKLAQIVPAPNEVVDKRFWEVAGMKSLVGFLLWMQNH